MMCCLVVGQHRLYRKLRKRMYGWEFMCIYLSIDPVFTNALYTPFHQAGICYSNTFSNDEQRTFFLKWNLHNYRACDITCWFLMHSIEGQSCKKYRRFYVYNAYTLYISIFWVIVKMNDYPQRKMTGGHI